MPSIAFGFDAENKAAQRAAARQAAQLVTSVSIETKAALRKLIARAIKDGIPPYDAGRLIEGMVGLNSRQMEAAYNLRVRLINSGLPIDKVDKKINRYQAKLLKQRGRMIARTEIMSSLANGTEESWTQAQAQGKIGVNAQKEWIITPLDACKICRSIDGLQVPLKMPFMSMVGPISNPTAHPNCRCAIVVVPGPAAARQAAPAQIGRTPQPWKATSRKPRRRTRTREPEPSTSSRPFSTAPDSSTFDPRGSFVTGFESSLPSTARREFGLKASTVKPKPPIPKPRPSATAPTGPGPLRSLNVIGGEADDALTKGIVTSQQEIAAGTSSETILVEGKGFKGVFKPTRGEGWGYRDAITNKKFTLADREVFSQVVDRKLGTNMIPTTRLRTVKGQGDGSIQNFVDHAHSASDSSSWLGRLAKSDVNRDDITSQFILDLAIGNTDRHSGNFMIGQLTKRPGVGMKPGQEIAQRTVTSIDNGLTFPAQTRLQMFGRVRGFDVPTTTYIDRLGLDQFRNETFDFLKSRGVRTLLTNQRERLLANIDATDWDKLARTTNMNGLERNAFTARMKWLRERIDKDDLFDELERLGYKNEWGFERSNIPGATELVE